jgi:hypothetical protein
VRLGRKKQKAERKRVTRRTGEKFEDLPVRGHAWKLPESSVRDNADSAFPGLCGGICYGARSYIARNFRRAIA